jgi:TatA/E family protein of Tat protein translocase
MFGLGVTEVLVILVVAFLLFGPQQLPEVGRQVGKAIKGLKEATEDVRKSVEPELDLMQAEMKSVEQDMESSMKEAEESIKNSVEENQGDEVKKA